MAGPYYTDQAALQNDPQIGNRAQGLKITGIVLFATTIYTMLGTEAAAEKVRLFKLPPRAMVDPTLSSVVSNGVAGVACTVDIGDDDDEGVGAAADPDRYADGLDVAAAGIDQFSSIAAAARLTPYVTSKECWCELTFATLNTPTAGGKLVVRTGYIVVA
jgi:hypothetical protein